MVKIKASKTREDVVKAAPKAILFYDGEAEVSRIEFDLGNPVISKPRKSTECYRFSDVYRGSGRLDVLYSRTEGKFLRFCYEGPSPQGYNMPDIVLIRDPDGTILDEHEKLLMH